MKEIKKGIALKLTCLLITGLIFSCQKEADTASPSPEIKGASRISFKESLDLWNKLKTKNGNSYVYATRLLSWTGYDRYTTIQVIDGIVTSRTYKAFSTGENGERELIKSYTEHLNDLGSHEEGDLPLSIDQLYESCKKHYLVVNPDENTVYFDTNEAGVISLCGYVPNGCADDCYSGFLLITFDWIK